VRWEERRFVVQGPKLLGEALNAGVVPDAVYLDAAGSNHTCRTLAERARDHGTEVFELAAGVLARASDEVNPQPVAAVVPMVDVPLVSLAEPIPSVLLVCVAVQDPGNAGTVVRSAAASGVGAVIFCAGAVDIFNPKAVRASAGAVFHVPIVAGPGPAEVLGQLGDWGFTRLATVARGGRDYATVDLGSPTALVLGSETHGLPDSLTDRLDGRVTIPMASSSESLNVAMAATILCFEAARRGRADRPGEAGAGPPR